MQKLIRNSKIQQLEVIIFGLLTILAIVIVFHKTVFLGEPISRLDILYQLDFLYNSALTGVTPTAVQDPSTPLQSFPKEGYLQQCIKHFLPPTWNSLSGAGVPLIADLSNSLLNPVDLLVGTADQRLYNIGIVLKIVITAYCTFLYCCRKGSAAWASAIGAVSYSLFSRGLRIAELAETFLGTPIVFLAFSFLDHKDLKSCIKTACILALAYYSMHPEGFFVSVLAASALWFLETTFCAPQLLKNAHSESSEEGIGGNAPAEKTTSGDSTIGKALWSFGALLIAGIISVCFVSPSLFAFLEFLKLAYSYKYTAQGAEFLRLEQIPFYLAIAKVKYSLFPGLVTVIGFPSCLLNWRRNLPALCLLIFWLLFETRPGVLTAVLGQAPLSFLLPEYSFSVIMFLFCALSAIGLSSLSKAKTPLLRRCSSLLLGLVLATAPLLLAIKHISAEDYSSFVSTKVIITTLGLGVLICFLLMLSSRLVSGFSYFSGLALLVINLITMWGGVRAELPITQSVSFPPAEHKALIDKLASMKDGRMIACGDRLLQPNTSLIYGLSDFRTCSPMLHEGYLNFVKAAGGNLGYCNMVHFPRTLSQLVDLASIRYILTDRPLRSNQDNALGAKANLTAPVQPKTIPFSLSSGRLMPGLRLLAGTGRYYPDEAAIEIELHFSNYLEAPNRYHIQIRLLDSHEAEIWVSPYETLANGLDKKKHSSVLTHLIPAPIRSVKNAFLSLSVLDSWTQTPIQPDGKTLTVNRSGIKLGSTELQASVESDVNSVDKRFVLIYEGKNLLRIYENRNAHPSAYLANRSIAARDEQEALILLQKRKLAENEVIIEDAQFKKIAAPIDPIDNTSPGKISLLHKDNVSSSYECTAANDCLFIQTSLFYPGWNAYLDGKKVSLLRANSIFCAILLPAGKHIVEFRYESPVILAGNVLLLVALAGCIFFSIRSKRSV